MTFKPTLLALCLAALPALAGDITAGDLRISDPFAFATPKAAMAGAGYLEITNTGPLPDRLLEVRAAVPKVGLHLSEMTGGVASMSPVTAVDLPPGETVALAPGGLHIMFMGLRGTPLVAGEDLPATLVFERAGEVDITFAIRTRGDEGGHGDQTQGAAPKSDTDHGDDATPSTE